eukprot:8704431-Ditylum_brightwellii.AAC.1
MGHLRLVMPPADYTARNDGIAYVASPNNPGPYDGTIANNTGSVQRSRKNMHQRLERYADTPMENTHCG